MTRRNRHSLPSLLSIFFFFCELILSDFSLLCYSLSAHSLNHCNCNSTYLYPSLQSANRSSLRVRRFSNSREPEDSEVGAKWRLSLLLSLLLTLQRSLLEVARAVAGLATKSRRGMETVAQTKTRTCASFDFSHVFCVFDLRLARSKRACSNVYLRL